MGLFKSSSIKKKLYLSFACMWAIMIFFAFFRGQQLNNVMTRYNHAMEPLNIQQQYIGNIVTDLTTLRFNDLILGAFSDYYDLYERITPLLGDRDYKISSLFQFLHYYRSAVLADSILTVEESESHIAILDDMLHILYEYYIPSGEAMIAALEAGDSRKFAEALFTNFSFGYTLTNLAWELRDRTFIFVDYVTYTMQYYDQIEDRIFNVATVIGISIAIFLAVILARTIQKPISELKAAMAEVSSGNLTHPIRMEYDDDIGRLSNDIADMVESVSKMIDTAAAQKYRIEQQERYEAQIQQALSEVRTASEAKTNFIANTSHEIRTPMNSIIGYCELAMDDDISDKSREYLSNILKSAKLQLRILNDILDFSKIEAGKIELDLSTFDINSVINSGHTSVAHEAQKKGLQLDIRVDTPSEKLFIGDSVKLTQACLNLLANAVKFTDSGTVSCTITTTEQNESSCKLRFEFSDTGIGMTEEQIDKIFDPFVQANADTTRRFGGTGLGLSITASYIDAMGGKLSVNSVLGQGSTFFFELTFYTVTHCDNFTKNVSMITKPMFNNEEVLVAEDNEMNQGVICEHLKRVNLTPIVATDGKIAVEMVKQRQQENYAPFSIIFMDLHMPVMDGIKAATLINEMGVTTPIIATTATLLSDNGKVFNSNTIDGSITKPFTAEELYETLLKFLTPNSDNKNTVLEMHEEKKSSTLIRAFFRQNHDIFEKIVNAIDSGDLTLAHRFAHGLKSNAGLIGELPLQLVATSLEERLNDKLPVGDLLDKLKTELEPVLLKISSLVDDSNAEETFTDISQNEILQVFNELEALLKRQDSRVINYIDKLRAIPSTETLIEQLENMDLQEAALTLATLKGD